MFKRSFSSKWVPSAGTYPAGFLVNGIETGVKKSGKDLSLITSVGPCIASTVFTKNSFCAAPVQLSKIISQLAAQSGKGIHGIVINSGCANACTGEKGLEDAKTMVQAVDTALKLKSSNAQTLVCSTGVIGQNLQMDKIKVGIEKIAADLGSDHDHWLNAASGIMTTDTFPKLVSKEIVIGGKKVRLAGICKGAGMIHPNMATMLGIICSDVSISQSCLDSALKYSVDRSFNAISVDGDTSTNDSLAILANGVSGCAKITDVKSLEYMEFEKELTEFSQQLSQLIVRDGEGATKFIEIVVKGAKTFQDAKQVASKIATSPLVKTAIYGKDANWGRIVCAVGYSGVFIIPDKVNLYMGARSQDRQHDLHLFKDGSPFDVNEDKASEILENSDLTITVDLGIGTEVASIFTCDLSHEYITINADYRS